MGLLNYTSSVPAERTINEIQSLLAKHGVSGVLTEYEGRSVSAVSFKMDIQGKSMGFKLPCNWRAVIEIFRKSKKHGKITPVQEDQAIRTAWRIIKDWVEAQLAMVEVNMVTVPQIFLPYAVMRDGRTLSEHVETNPSFLLGEGSQN